MFILVFKAVNLGILLGGLYGLCFFEVKTLFARKKYSAYITFFFIILMYAILGGTFGFIVRYGTLFTIVTLIGFMASYWWYLIRRLKAYGN